ncbi:MAG: DoxX family protein [Flavobacteriia bacterium]|nr:DoxX family protein [Flavobacteriia bacterium]
MNALKKYGPWTIRAIISFVFFLSAIAKLYPKPSYALTSFEVHQLEPMGIPLEIAAYLSRFLIGIEFAIAILLLLPFFLRKIIIPATVLMLVVFIVELFYEIFSSGNQGNCGCFGTLIEMTPLEALIKNVISVGLLLGYYWLDKKEEILSFDLRSRAHFSAIFNVLTVSIFGVFLAAPIRREAPTTAAVVPVEKTMEDSVTAQKKDTAVSVQLKNADTSKVVKPLEPKEVLSGFETLFPNINKGKQILCFFAPGCDHCRATAKAITALKKSNKQFPPVNIIFMDEEPELIPDFFKFAGSEYTYSVMDIIKFWKTLGSGKEVPGVMYLWNGNLQKFYQGIDKEQFNSSDFKKVLNKRFS